MTAKTVILCVDDEKNVIESIRLNIRGRYEVLTALSADDGLSLIADRPDIAVVLSDMRMPGKDGAAFLAQVRIALPQAVRMLLTGYSDIEAAMRAVNEGQIFRFLTKPCPPDQLMTAIAAGAEQHRLVTAERELLQKTLLGSVKALVDVLALSNPMALGRASRIRDKARLLVQSLALEHGWRVEFAALLSQLGSASLADDTLRKLYDGEDLDPQEVNSLVENVATINRILANIPRLDPVITLLEELNKITGGSAIDVPAGRFTLEARILQASIALDAHEARGLSFRESLAALEQRRELFGAELLSAIASLAKDIDRKEVRDVVPADLADDMVLCEDLKTRDGVLIMPRGFPINYTSREHILSHWPELGRDSIRVMIPRQDAAMQAARAS